MNQYIPMRELFAGDYQTEEIRKEDKREIMRSATDAYISANDFVAQIRESYPDIVVVKRRSFTPIEHDK